MKPSRSLLTRLLLQETSPGDAVSPTARPQTPGTGSWTGCPRRTPLAWPPPAAGPSAGPSPPGVATKHKHSEVSAQHAGTDNTRVATPYPLQALFGEPGVQVGVPVLLAEPLLGHRVTLEEGDPEHALLCVQGSASGGAQDGDGGSTPGTHSLCSLAQQQPVEGA